MDVPSWNESGVRVNNVVASTLYKITVLLLLLLITTNRHRAHVDPTVRDECPFCFKHDDVYHLFLQCERLKPMFLLLEEWSKNFNFEFI